MNRALWKLIRGYIYCILAILCLCAAGSDGDYFPWVNIIGTLILVIMAMVHLRNKQRSDILSRAEQRQSVKNMERLNIRLGSLNERIKSREAAVGRN